MADPAAVEAFMKGYNSRPNRSESIRRRKGLETHREWKEGKEMGREDVKPKSKPKSKPPVITTTRNESAANKKARIAASRMRAKARVSAKKREAAKSNAQSFKPKTVKKRKAFDPKLLFKRSK